MVDPIYTYVGGIAFLVLIIGTMLYLTFSTTDIEEGDEHPGESVVGGIDAQAEDGEFESGEPSSEDGPSLVDEEPADGEETEGVNTGEGTEAGETDEAADVDDESDANADDESDANADENA